MEYYYRHDNESNLIDKAKEALKGINKAKISTAFLSLKGVKYLKKIIEDNPDVKGNIVIYISREFSRQKSAILQEIVEIADVFIVNECFHAKVYYFQKENGKDLLIFGSSNLTEGGIERNIEFDVITEDFDEKEIDKFFMLCAKNVTKVDDDVIQFCRKQDKEQKSNELDEKQQESDKEFNEFLNERQQKPPRKRDWSKSVYEHVEDGMVFVLRKDEKTLLKATYQKKDNSFLFDRDVENVIEPNFKDKQGGALKSTKSLYEELVESGEIDKNGVFLLKDKPVPAKSMSGYTKVLLCKSKNWVEKWKQDIEKGKTIEKLVKEKEKQI